MDYIALQASQSGINFFQTIETRGNNPIVLTKAVYFHQYLEQILLP